MCVPILRCSRVTEHSVEACWSSQVCTSPVTLAEWQKGANGCCYARLPEHLLWVTLLFHCHFAPSDSTGKSALLFQYLPPNLHLIDAIFRQELMNDLCCGRCELLHSNQSHYGIVKQLNYFNYLPLPKIIKKEKDCTYPHTHKKTMCLTDKKNGFDNT